MLCQCGQGYPRREGGWCMRIGCRPEGQLPTKTERRAMNAEARPREKLMPIYRHVRDMNFVEILEEFTETLDADRKSELREALQTLSRDLVWDRQ